MYDIQNSTALAERFKELCRAKRMSYREISDKLAIPVSRVTRIADGTTRDPRISTMVDICDALGVSLDEFFDTEEFWDMRG